MISPYLLRLRQTQLRRPYRRTFVTESLRNLTNAYFDLSIALPYPVEWPAYTTTIIVLGIASRVSLLPLSIWARRREDRMENQVIPYLKAYRARLDDKIRQELETADSAGARVFYTRAANEKLNAKRNELLKKYRCTPWMTLSIPILVQAPVFMGLSTIFLRAAKEPGSVLREESFFTLQSLAHPDATMAFPVLLGLISLATVETSHWFMAEKRGRPLEIARPREKGKVVINPRRYIKGMMRGLSLGRIILAAMMPGSVEIYWLTSAAFGLFTNWILNYTNRFVSNEQKPSSVST